MEMSASQDRRRRWWPLSHDGSQRRVRSLVGAVVHRDGEAPYVDCPIRMTPTPYAECGGCARLERVSSLYDTGAVVQMVLCNPEPSLPSRAGQ